MTKKMLIDASHEEETRIAIVEDNRLEEFDYESAMRKPLKGNIFLAKVTRIEPSLQAAFVNYGGNRHGFLPFSEIHPDYFRIPVADQEEFEAMQREQLEEHDKQEEEDLGEEITTDETSEDNVEEVEVGDEEIAEIQSGEVIEAPAEDEDSQDEAAEKGDDAEEAELDSDEESSDAEDSEEGENKRRGRGGRNNRGRGRGRGRAAHRSRRPENFGDDEAGQAQRFRFNLRRKYKIQEVVKRGQIMLIQVSREERGNKGAAVSTYLSLPGRYTVLMPNSPRGGGVSRKIANYKDRSKMKELLSAMEVPAGMSAIVRTAGVTRTKTEIKRDMDYLMRQWNEIREVTLNSSAPALVYEEADLIKRAVRDLYTRDIDEIQVAGDGGFKAVKGFMKLMIPSHVKKIKHYEDESTSLFQRYNVESQIADIGETEVHLPSGGYLVINPTEALVSIDVNSGRSIKERNIENTALRTNLEAAEEVARQLRLRDLGGLVVVDFIDMEDRRNNGKVERKMRDALSGDRARIQVGRISSFGLMEMSRQRMNASLGESQFETCPHCEGRGAIRTADSAALLVIRAIETEALKKRAAQIMAHVPARVALYLLNNKRNVISELEARYGLQIAVRVDDGLSASAFRVEVAVPADKNSDEQPEETNAQDDDNNQDKKSSRNRRGRRGGRGRNRGDKDRDENASSDENDQAEEASDTKEEDEKKPKRRNSRRKKSDAEKAEVDASEENALDEKAEGKSDDQPAEDEKPKRKSRAKKVKIEEVTEDAPKNETSEEAQEDKPKKKAGARKKKADDAKADDTKAADNQEAADEKPKAKKATKSKAAKPKASNDDQPEAEERDATEYETVNEAPKKKRKGWWNKLVD